MFVRLPGYCSKEYDQNICFLMGSSAFRIGLEEYTGDKVWITEQQICRMIAFLTSPACFVHWARQVDIKKYAIYPVRWQWHQNVYSLKFWIKVMWVTLFLAFTGSWVLQFASVVCSYLLCIFEHHFIKFYLPGKIWLLHQDACSLK